MFLKSILLVVHIVSLGHCSNILAIVPTPSYSHQVAFFDFWSQLSLRGHKVTVITTDPQKNEAFTNLTEIDVRWSYKFWEEISKVAESVTDMWNLHSWFSQVSYNMTKAQLSDYHIQELINDKSKHFDVLLLETFYPEYLGFAELYKCPIILVNSLDALLNFHVRMGNTVHPVLHPNIGSPFKAPLDFRERVTSSIYSLYTWIYYDFVVFAAKEQILHTFFNTSSTINEMMAKVDMMFLNVNPVMHTVRAIGPSTVNIGGLRKISVKPLSKDLKDFLDSATNGFVYFSLGSNVKSKELQAESLKSILETLGELPLKVLWKFEADPDAMPGKPDNVKLIKWAPQLDILAHPNIKLFITQGGLQSMEETIYNEVPCVVIPFFADQEQNAKLMKNKGFAEIVGRHPYIKKEDLKNAIHEVVNNPKYKNSVSTLKRLSLDTPMTGLEQAIWWTEYVIRNKGAKHLRNPAADLPLYQYYLLDVVGFLLSVTILTLWIIFIVVRKLVNLFKVRFPSRSVLVHKKLQ